MSVTYGFYNSVNGDRKYDAVQMSNIFDGIIRDGVFQHLGTAMMVIESEGMIVNVGIGRAWFNHTWTLNDALLPLEVPISEVILNRIDVVVLEVDARENIRANSIKIIKGTPASSPKNPEMIKTNDRWQYPLAYIQVNAGVTAIRQADITNMIGTDDCPFISGILKTISIDQVLPQWRDELDRFMENEEARCSIMFEALKESILSNKAALDKWIASEETEFIEWFESKKNQLNGDVAGKLQIQIDKLNIKTYTGNSGIYKGIRPIDSKIESIYSSMEEWSVLMYSLGNENDPMYAQNKDLFDVIKNIIDCPCMYVEIHRCLSRSYGIAISGLTTGTTPFTVQFGISNIGKVDIKKVLPMFNHSVLTIASEPIYHGTTITVNTVSGTKTYTQAVTDAFNTFYLTDIGTYTISNTLNDRTQTIDIPYFGKYSMTLKNKVPVTINGAPEETITFSSGDKVVLDANGTKTGYEIEPTATAATGSISGYTKGISVEEIESGTINVWKGKALYWYGRECIPWIPDNPITVSGAITYGTITLTKNSNDLTLNKPQTTYSWGGQFVTKDKIDMTNYKLLCAHAVKVQKYGGTNGNFTSQIAAATGYVWQNGLSAENFIYGEKSNDTDITKEVDITNVNGENYARLTLICTAGTSANVSSGNMTVDAVWLE